MDNLIRVQRAIRRMSQKELAWALGIREQTIQLIESNKVATSIVVAKRIAKYFDVSVDDLFILDPEELIFRTDPMP